MAPAADVRSLSPAAGPDPPAFDGTLFAAIRDAVLYARFPDRQVLDVNQAFCALFGVTREHALAGTTAFMYHSEEDFREVGRQIGEAMAKGNVLHLEWTFRRHDGSPLPAELIVHPVRTYEGTPTGAVSVIRDLSREKLLEEASTLLLRGTLDAEEVARSLAKLAARGLAGSAAVDLLSPDGQPHRVGAGSAAGGQAPALPLPAEAHARYSTLAPGEAHVGSRPEGTHVLLALAGKRGLLGGLILARGTSRPFTERELAVARDLAARGGLAVENALLHGETKMQQARWRSLVEHAPDHIYLADRDGKILFINRVREGVALGDVVGHTLYEWLSPPEQETFRAALRQVFEEGKRARVLIHPAGGGDFECRLAPVTQEGRVVATCVSARDVTEQLDLAERQRAQQAKLETLLRAQQDIASTLDLEKLVQAATDAATAISGAQFGAFFYNVEDAAGARYMLYSLSGAPREAFSHFPMPRATAIFAPTFAGAGVVRSDDVTAHPDYGKNAPHAGMPQGHLPVRSYLAVPVVSRDGTVHGGFFLGHGEPAVFTAESEALVVALAAQTATALDNARLYERALASEERFKRVLDNAPAQILTIDAQGRLRTLNYSATGAAPSELVGLDIYGTIVPEDRDRVRGIIEAVMRDGVPAEYETQGSAFEGERRWYHVRVAPLREAGGSGAILIASDVTERREEEHELARTRALLIQNEKLAALGGLVAGVAHELRTPLTFLSNNAYLLRLRLDRAAARGASAEEALRDASSLFSDMSTGVDRINRIVEDLRRYTRARHDAGFEKASLDRLVGDAVDIFRATSRSRNPLETSLSTTPDVRANRGAVQQLVLNLLQNGADASPPGARLRVVTTASEGVPVLRVEDEGSGIPAEVLARMYDPLFTTKSSGTGLGLTIVKRIADEHGATIHCTSTPGRGTTFEVRFPLAG